MLLSARCGFHKKYVKTRYTELVFLHPVRYAGHVVHSGTFGAYQCTILHAQVELVWIRQKAHQDMLHQTCVSASG
jgi:hypothetical protein